MATLTGNFDDLIAPGLRKVWFEEYMRRPEQFSQIFNIESSDRNYEKDTTIAGFGAMPVKTQGASVVYEDPAQGFDKTYTHQSYGLGFRVSEEMFDDDLYGVMKRMPKALAISAKQAIEVTAANIFNNGFNSSFTGGDAKELFATDHPLEGGGTGRNELSTSSDLSVTSLKQALIDFEDGTVDGKGLPLLFMPKFLVVPTNLGFDATELLKSSLLPGTANNDINSLGTRGLEPFVLKYLTDTDAWFLLSDTHALTFLWRKKPVFSSMMDFDTGDAKFKANMRFSVGFSDWRGVFGSPGA